MDEILKEYEELRKDVPVDNGLGIKDGCETGISRPIYASSVEPTVSERFSDSPRDTKEVRTTCRACSKRLAEYSCDVVLKLR